MAILNVLAIVVAGLMVGSELTIAALFTQPLCAFRILFICQPQALWRVRFRTDTKVLWTSSSDTGILTNYSTVKGMKCLRGIADGSTTPHLSS